MRITASQTSYTPDGPPPRFQIDTGGERFFAVQVASEAILFSGGAASRRAPANFFDSWSGDAAFRPDTRGFRPQVAGQRLEAPTGQASYTLPAPVWARLRRATRLSYRLVVNPNDRRRVRASVTDQDWQRAPAVIIGRLPAQPPQNPAARFRGGGPLAQPDFLQRAAEQVAARGMVSGRDGDWRYVLLDARRFQLTVIDCGGRSLTEALAAMPRKPDAVINGQFIKFSGLFDWAVEGQVIREGQLLRNNSQPNRYHLAQTWRGLDVSDYRVGLGNPKAAVPQARVAFGGLGPVLLGGAPPTAVTPFTQSIYRLPAAVGRGVIAIERGRSLILLLVQAHDPPRPANLMTMPQLQAWLRQIGFDDVLFNDGSDSEALYAAGGWLLEPAPRKDAAMTFAIGFVERARHRRIRALAIDGTKTPDGLKFVQGIERPQLTHYLPRNLAPDLRGLSELAPIAAALSSHVLEAHRAKTQATAAHVARVVAQGGAGGHWADILYISSHASRHGQLWYHAEDKPKGATLTIADPWSPGFRPAWRTTPSWLILAGCGVLGLHYSRAVALTASERAQLIDLHRDIYGAAATVPGLVPAKKILFGVYHPGWAWYERIFRTSPSLRGVLGYWYRSPSKGDDVPIIEEFCERLRAGEPLLAAWEAANRRAWYQFAAKWAAMVREGCAGDTLASLEDPAPATRGEFRYYDEFQRGKTMIDAYRLANSRPEVERVGTVDLRHNPHYDEPALDEFDEHDLEPTAATLLIYNDGVGPPAR
jgi:hypothetical protein